MDRLMREGDTRHRDQPPPGGPAKHWSPPKQPRNFAHDQPRNNEAAPKAVENGHSEPFVMAPAPKPIENRTGRPGPQNGARPKDGPASTNGEPYVRLACVGEGTYGRVYKARNVQTGEFVAFKRIRMDIEKDGFPVTALREIKLLQGLNHDNIVRLLEMMVSKGE